MIDDDPQATEARQLLGLAAETSVPSAIDINQAVNEGGRRVRRRQLLTSVAAVVAVCAIGVGTGTAVLLGRPAQQQAPIATPVISSTEAPSAPAGPPLAAAVLGDLSPQRIAGVTTDDGLLVATRGSDGRVNVRNPGTGQWSALDGVVSSSPAAATANGRVYLAARGTAGDLVLRWQDGGTWTQWLSLGGSIASAPSISAIGQNQLLVTVRTTAAQVAYARLALPSPKKADWTVLSGLTTSSAPLTGPLSTVDGCAGAVPVGARNFDDGKLYVASVCPTGSATGWRQAFDLKIASGGSIATPLTGTSAVIWFRAVNGHLWVWPGHGAPVQVGTPPNVEVLRIAGTPSAVIENSGSLVVLVRTTTGSVWAYTAPRATPATGRWASFGGYSS
jgi:hypothetical protein